jgi:3-oxoacyl-[acyl-carrier protein] reductase
MLGNQNILITGTSQGLGYALACHYLSHGHNVVGVSRSESRIDDSRYRHFLCDIRIEAEVQILFSSLRKHMDHLDVLINNAAISESAPALLTSGSQFDDIIRTNLIGCFLVSREAIKFMKRKGCGRVINFSSVNVPLRSPGSIAYNASKSAIENMAGSYARELTETEITINTVGLSLVENTGMLKQLSDMAVEDKQASLMKPDIITVQEIAHIIDFLCHPNALNITSQSIFFGGV